MALVAYVAPTPDLEDRFSKQATPLYKTQNSSLRWTGKLTPPRRKIDYTTKSLLPAISTFWAELSPAEKLAWKQTGASQGYSAWNMFVQDVAYRMKYGIEGLAEPSTLHAYKVGQITLGGTAKHFEIVQLHPVEYYKMKKVKGSKSQKEPVAIREVLTLPYTFGLSYRTNLTAAGAAPRVRAYAKVIWSYQGRDIIEECGFDIPLVSEWQRQEQTLTGVAGHARWYTLHIELVDCQGTLQFDRVLSRHNSTNFARDFRCHNIAAGYNNVNYQLPPSWAAAEAVTGAFFGSVYPNDGGL